MQRKALILFGALFAALFVTVALVVGISSPPEVPADDVAIIEDAPPGLGAISNVEFRRAMKEHATQAGLKTAPRPGKEGYEAMKDEVVRELVTAVWLRGQAEVMHIRFSEKKGQESATTEFLVRKIEEALEERAIRASRDKSSPKELEEQKQEVFHEYDEEFRVRWESRTYCADGFIFEQCANYPLFLHSYAALPSCYEANPTKPPEGCPAPIVQTQPVLPGTVTLSQPQGKSLPQRPYPEVSIEGQALD